jgi:Fe-S oxidoreductase
MALIKRLKVDLKEMPPSGDAKMKQVEASGAERLATSCSNCRLTFDDG